jgi:hypothetical protein
MAIGQKIKKHHGGRVKGANEPDPTRASKPAEPTYRYPLQKGLGTLAPKLDAAGNAVPLTNYGQRYAGPSSVSVTDSDGMSDLDIGVDDEALASLKTNGHGDQPSGEVAENSATSDLTRKIDTTQYPATFGMTNRSDPAKAIKISGNIGAPVADGLSAGELQAKQLGRGLVRKPS